MYGRQGVLDQSRLADKQALLPSQSAIGYYIWMEWSTGAVGVGSSLRGVVNVGSVYVCTTCDSTSGGRPPVLVITEGTVLGE